MTPTWTLHMSSRACLASTPTPSHIHRQQYHASWDFTWDMQTFFETSMMTPLMPTATGGQRKEGQDHVQHGRPQGHGDVHQNEQQNPSIVVQDMKVDISTSSLDVFKNTTMFVVTSLWTWILEKTTQNFADVDCHVTISRVHVGFSRVQVRRHVRFHVTLDRIKFSARWHCPSFCR
jgi:hypothetical protein